MDSADNSKARIGVIGLGLMGRPMAMNLLKAGHPVTVWNRTASRADELVSAGATLGKSPREVAAGADVLITMVSEASPAISLRRRSRRAADSSVRRTAGLVVFAAPRILPSPRVCGGNCNPPVDDPVVDAPVTGGDWGAKKGELVFMVGGDADALKAMEPIIGVMGKRWFLLGPNGAGQTIKLAMNLILALQVDALAEALALVTRAGLKGESLVEVMQSSMARSGVLDVKAPNLLKGEYTPSFPLRLMHKDLSLVLELANQIGVALPAAAAARETYNYVKGASKQDLDYSAVMKFWQP